VLPHSLRPGRTFGEISRIGAEFEQAGEAVVGLVPQADIAFLYSARSKWALQDYPALATDAGEPDPHSYRGIFDSFYRGAFDAKLQARILHVEQLIDPADPGSAAAAAVTCPVLVVPGLYVSEDATLDWLLDYVAAGGHLVLGPRSGYGDHEGRARTDVMPSRLSEAAGVWYDEFSNLVRSLPVVKGSGAPGSAAPWSLTPGASATRWADGLIAEGAQPLAVYDHPHFGQWAAVTTRAHGAGRITVVGTVPDLALAVDLFTWVGESLPQPVWRPENPSVTATSSRNAAGRLVRFVHNWSWEPTTVTLPGDVTDVVSGATVSQGGGLALGAWDVRVLIEDAP
jgi:beta-galactosidase